MAQSIGFEPDEVECVRLSRSAGPKYRFFQFAVGESSEDRPIYITRNPACSSLLKPNLDLMSHFLRGTDDLEVVETGIVRTVSLDGFLPTVDVSRVDFLDLDTQGTELDVLRGAKHFLGHSVLGINVEVEFSPIYGNQPLFNEVDSYLSQFGFVLFDLSRFHYRRKRYPIGLETRGQLLYGKAIYLKDHYSLPDTSLVEDSIALCVIAGYHGFHDYALDVLDNMLDRLSRVNKDADFQSISSARRQYVTALNSRSKVERLVRWLLKSKLRWLLHKAIPVCRKFDQAFTSATTRSRFNWED